jgi:hypothetical protein
MEVLNARDMLQLASISELSTSASSMTHEQLGNSSLRWIPNTQPLACETMLFGWQQWQLVASTSLA